MTKMSTILKKSGNEFYNFRMKIKEGSS